MVLPRAGVANLHCQGRCIKVWGHMTVSSTQESKPADMLESSSTEDDMKPNQHTASRSLRSWSKRRKVNRRWRRSAANTASPRPPFTAGAKPTAACRLTRPNASRSWKEENTRLKRLLAEWLLEVDALKELLAKKPDHHGAVRCGALPGGARHLGAACLHTRPVVACHLPVWQPL